MPSSRFFLGPPRFVQTLRVLALEKSSEITIPRFRPSCVLPKAYCKKDPCKFNMEMFVSKVGKPCPSFGLLLASRIVHALLEGGKLGCTPRGSCNRTLLRRVLRRFSNSTCFLEGFLEGACKGFQSRLGVLRRVLRRELFIEGA